MHRRQKYMHAPLSRALREELKKRNAQLRKGDTVKVVRGDHAGTEGAVEDVDIKRCTIKVAGVSNYRGAATVEAERKRQLIEAEVRATEG